MKGRIIFGLVCAAVLALACGPRLGTGESVALLHAPRAHAASQSAPTLISTLAVDVRNGVTMDFSVMNESPRRLELNFRNGQTHDLIVVDSLGREVWRWSSGRMFTQSLQNKVLRASDKLDYDAVWRNAPAGKYTAIATLASENYPVEQRAEFVVH